MVIINGTIQAKVKTGGGLDENGNPARPSETFGEPIPARVITNNKNNLGKQDGNTFIAASYEILIEPQTFEAERVRLTRFGRDMGEFSVMSAEYLETVGSVKIIVKHADKTNNSDAGN
ncbi:MAG: hypothetical protein FWF53_03375 [Candidatus Azobacteroides sp.]|nr:hypothetical protein [Candidatus Azobacteroides sp.]